MLIKNNQLKFYELDYAIAVIEQPENFVLRYYPGDTDRAILGISEEKSPDSWLKMTYNPTMNWNLAEPLLNKYNVKLEPVSGKYDVDELIYKLNGQNNICATPNKSWQATVNGHIAFGATVLIAAMRAIVMFKNETQTEIPDVLHDPDLYNENDSRRWYGME